MTSAFHSVSNLIRPKALAALCNQLMVCFGLILVHVLVFWSDIIRRALALCEQFIRGTEINCTACYLASFSWNMGNPWKCWQVWHDIGSKLAIFYLCNFCHIWQETNQINQQISGPSQHFNHHVFQEQQGVILLVWTMAMERVIRRFQALMTTETSLGTSTGQSYQTIQIKCQW